MSANKHRGEVSITLGGKEYTLRPSFEAIADIEERTGRGTVALTRLAASGDIGVGRAAIILHALMTAGGHKVDLKDVGSMILEAGIVSVLPAIMVVLGNVLAGGTEPGESAAAAGKTKSPSAA